ncbi:NAD-dependent epimerase/dehydratase family protein [Vampirovibrio chlorellavorus]|uniref:NAD-dependent epimerase/dehydratase family protein n=1 Tax=Vampirovibrio chlorellavorus TaxID=758823 RepID=UPI0026E9616F|nr:NAD-dependent epimerase/dehydratase family protein [Vampirovibrio chlorellavorus]
MTIFVTGSTGFVGRNLLEYLVKTQPQQQFVCLVRDLAKARAQWAQQPPNIRWLVGDLLRPDTYREALQSAELVFHVAALVGLRDGDAFFTQNTEATRQLVYTLTASNRLRRLVFVSSISATDRYPGSPATDCMTEAFPSQPQTDYGRSKLQAEQRIMASGLPYTIMAPAYIYGPHLRAGASTERLINDLKAGKRYTRFPFPGAVSAIHVEDLSEALWIAATHPNTLNERFLISHPQPVSIVEALATLADCLGLHHTFTPSPNSNLERYRRKKPAPGGNAILRRILWEHYFACSPAKWYRATGHQPAIAFSDGVRKTLASLSKTP